MAAGAVQMLQKSLLEANKDLTSTNDAIRRLTGRDPDVRTPRPGPNRRISSERRISSDRRISGERRISGGRMRGWSEDLESPAAKRRDLFGGRSRLAGRLGPRVDGRKDSDEEENGERHRLAGRLGPRVDRRKDSDEEENGERHRLAGRLGPRVDRRKDSDEEENGEKEEGKPSLQSSVVATTAPPRPKADPHEDKASKTRNRRMFGFLMGTLQKFKEKEEAVKGLEKIKRRHEIEEKLERAVEVEKEVAIQERRELYQHRRAQQSKVARLENHMDTVQMYESWNEHDRLLRGYIKTRTQPPIFFRPVQHIPRTEELQQQSTAKIEELIRERQKEVDSILADNVTTTTQEPMEAEGEGSGKGEEGKGEEMEEGEIKGEAGSDSGELSD